MKKLILCLSLCFISSLIYSKENYDWIVLEDMVEWKLDSLEDKLRFIDKHKCSERYQYTKGQIDAYEEVLDMINMEDGLGPWDW